MDPQQTNILLTSMKSVISKTIPSNKIGIAFSGGVDSTLLVKVCCDMGYDVTLLTVGFSGSHDISFSRQVNEQLQLQHHVYEIDVKDFSQVLTKIRNKIKTDNLSWIENCLAFYYIAKLADTHRINYVITANGIDELFCGYHAYTQVVDDGAERVMDMMLSKIDNEIKMMNAIGLVISVEYDDGIDILQPLLSQAFIDVAKSIPISEKIHGPDDLYRKHIIRKLARQVNVPEISYTKRKKALQYGSKIHKMVMKVARQQTLQHR